MAAEYVNILSTMNVNVSIPTYAYTFTFEKSFVHYETRRWMMENWTIAFWYIALYVIFIFSGRELMKNRPRFELRGLLVLWNTILSAFAIIGFFRTAPELFHVLYNYGLYHSVCVPSYIELDHVAGFWTWLFVLSKLPELGDTVFIVLRKQPLIFLHWYHHITVLLYTWFSYTEYTSSARWFVVMNYFVHSLMYGYYALKAMRYNPPKRFAMVLTSLQLLQMVLGVYVNISAHSYLASERECNITPTNIRLSLTMYLSYFLLFSHFFYRAYLTKGGRRDAKVHVDKKQQ